MKKTNPFKRFRSSRVLLSLASCSVVLVIFGASIFGLSIPGVLSSGDRVSTFNETLFGGVDLASAEGGNENQAAIGDGATPLANAVAESSGGAVLRGAPTLGSSVGGDSSGASNGSGSQGTSQNAASSVSSNNASDQNKDQNQAQPDSTGTLKPQQSTVDPAAEQAYHDHIVKYFEMMKSDYEYICSGLENAYSCLDSQRSVSTAPVDAASYISVVDKRRAAAENCKYNGKHIDGRSQWFDEYDAVCTMYNNLENCLSIMREVNGMGPATARERFAYYSNSSGKLNQLAEFEEAYSRIRL